MEEERRTISQLKSAVGSIAEGTTNRSARFSRYCIRVVLVGLILQLCALVTTSFSQDELQWLKRPTTSFSQDVLPWLKRAVFDDVTIEDGLPRNDVTCILQDYLGYVWFGTSDGLARYDGYAMKVFQPDTNKPGSIRGRVVVTLYEDKNRILWIGTLGGLNSFDRAKESFVCYRYRREDTTSVNSGWIHCIYEDKTGRFWVGTANGLNLLDRTKEKFTRYYFTKGDSTAHSRSTKYDLTVNAICEDPASSDLLLGTELDGLWRFNVKEQIFSKYHFNGSRDADQRIGPIESFCKSRDAKIWMASTHTLSRLDPQKKELKCYVEFPITPQEQYVGPEFVRGTVIEDHAGLIWCGFTAGEKGIFCIDPESGRSQQCQYFGAQTKNSYRNNTYSLSIDRTGIIWIGTVQFGARKLENRKNQFELLIHDIYDSNSLADNGLGGMAYDPRGFLWFCTRVGLDRYDPKTRSFKHYLQNEKRITESLSRVACDRSGILWLGTGYGGLLRFNPSDGSYRFYFNNPHDSLNLVDKRIAKMIVDHLGYLWICTEGCGLYKVDVAKNKVTHFAHVPKDSSSLSDNSSHAIVEDRFGTLWVGAGELNRFDRITEKFTHCGFNAVDLIYEDKRGGFWIADNVLGLCLFDRERRAIVAKYGQKDGMPYVETAGMLEDDHNNLWIGTYNGLTRFSTTSRTFETYRKEDGLPTNFFVPFFSCYGPSGTMYFYTDQGPIAFHPDGIKDDPTPPQVVLSGVSLFNRPGEKLKCEGFISELKELTLPYDQNDLRFDFVGLHFSEPGGNKYKYILEHFDNTWVDAGNQRYATYTHLDPGEYVFRVKASNRDGVWNDEGASIKIIITPPWWRTTWAYAAYLLVFLGILYAAYWIRLRQLRLQQKVEMEHFQREHLAEVDRLKSRFFANISHEFRTPLTLILGPIQKWRDRTREEDEKKDMQMAERNAHRLLRLINQLLDLSKLEAGAMKLRATRMNIVPLVKGIAGSFESSAGLRHITLEVLASQEEIEVYIDKDMVEKILTNLLSNAFKFTPEGGTVTVVVGQNDILSNRVVDISVADTGIGIPSGELSKVFDRFYQVDASQTREHEGSGLGLALVKELVDLHHGTIQVQSEVGRGATFTVRLPLGRSHLKDDEIAEAPIEVERAPIETEEAVAGVPLEERRREESPEQAKGEKPIILVVEDNADVRAYIKDYLVPSYQIAEARDGAEGIETAVEIVPDLIISDVMMPKKDGYELCCTLKNDMKTSHIPIILLTAKAASENKIEGLEIGADDYLIKPFEPKELLARVKNLIDLRRKLRERFNVSVPLKPGEIAVTSMDDAFLKKVITAVERHIGDELFHVGALAAETGMSRAQLHRKLKALTNESPSEFIRYLRLHRAMELLQKEAGTISEIAYNVGFSDPSYFSKCFHKQFGKTPTDVTKASVQPESLGERSQSH